MRILFVCSGNTCRSPLAEAIARKLIVERELSGIVVESAGTQAWDGAPASDGAILVGIERGLELAAHRARRVTKEIVAAADIVLAMAPSHVAHVKELTPGADVHLLGGYGRDEKPGHTLQDPFGGDLVAYRETADDLEREIGAALERLTAR